MSFRLSTDFIRKFVTDEITNKRRRDDEKLVERTSIVTTVQQLVSSIKQIFNSNFPSVNTIELDYAINNIYSATSITGIRIINTSYDNTENILKGVDDISLKFKQHLDFIELTSDDNLVGKFLNKVYNEYFVYWDQAYYDANCVSTQNKSIIRADPIASLRSIPEVFGKEALDKIKIESSHLDVWGKNRPITYKYNNSLNHFDLELCSGFKIPATIYHIKSCPELDDNIRRKIIHEYRVELGIYYDQFNDINNRFVDMIIGICKYLLIDKKELTKELGDKHFNLYGYRCPLINDRHIRFEEYTPYSSYDATIEIKIPDSDPAVSIVLKYKQEKNHIEFHFNRITSTVGHFRCEINEERSEITLSGYSDTYKKDNIGLFTYTEAYRLAILRYAPKMIIEMQDYYTAIDASLSKLTDKESDE